MPNIREPDSGVIRRLVPLANKCAPAMRTFAHMPQLRSDPDERSLIHLIQGFSASGGVVGSDKLVAMLCRYHDQPISWLARRIVQRRVLHISWRSQMLVPMFQFDLVNMFILEGAKSAMINLVEVFDDWELATWFAEPNAWLSNRRPADVVVDDASAVIDAARADWFVAAGA